MKTNRWHQITKFWEFRATGSINRKIFSAAMIVALRCGAPDGEAAETVLTHEQTGRLIQHGTVHGLAHRPAGEL